ncbi:MAG: PIN/TRAM domain-containing protein, partial [Aphanocapsa feldmannii 288cV]
MVAGWPTAMVDTLILVLFLLTGAVTAVLGVDLLPPVLLDRISNLAGFRWLAGGCGGTLALLIGLAVRHIRRLLLRNLEATPTDLLVSRAVGLILGLLLANLLLAPILLLPLPWEAGFLKPLVAVVSNIVFGVSGYGLAETHGRTLLRLYSPASTEALLVSEGVMQAASPKVLDTSAIIDGRIQALVACGLLEGRMIVPQAVIDELQQLADSANEDKRGKGRRGLKLLGKLRERYGKRLVINTTRYQGDGVDDKLLQLTADSGATLITTDYNLAKVAGLQELRALCISELVVALRPEVQPGDECLLKIVREGKEAEQGIGYLEDGTMVVVDGARSCIGTRLRVIVTGALQT